MERSRGECCSGKENLDDIRAKPFQAIHKHILARKPHNCLLEIQDVPQSRNGSMGSNAYPWASMVECIGMLFYEGVSAVWEIGR